MDWLRAICDQNSVEICERPWTISYDGRSITAATNGYLCVVVDGSFGEPPDPNSRIEKNIAYVLDPAGYALTGQTTAEDLAAWAEPYESSRVVSCRQCGGDGRCNQCDCQQEHQCGNCKGSGKDTDDPEPRYGTIGGHLFNRNLLAKAAPHVSGPCAVKIKAGGEPVGATLRIEGAGWIIVTIGSKNNTEERGPALPLINVPTALATAV